MWTYTKLKLNTCPVVGRGGRTRSKERKEIFFPHPRYILEAMESSMVDVKADKLNDGTTACLTRCWVDESHETTARIK